MEERKSSKLHTYVNVNKSSHPGAGNLTSPIGVPLTGSNLKNKRWAVAKNSKKLQARSGTNIKQGRIKVKNVNQDKERHYITKSQFIKTSEIQTCISQSTL